MSRFQVAIIGAGPAGSSCAATLALGGQRVVLIERAEFPREKVCGDCLNPACWPVLTRLGCAEKIRTLPQAPLDHILFGDATHDTLRLPLPLGAEIAIKRSHLDHALLTHAKNCGAEIRTNTQLTALNPGWRITTTSGELEADWLIAADGRNSTALRLLGLAPPAHRDRIGLQTHFPRPTDTAGQVAMRFLPGGYSGFADVGDGAANLCLVGTPDTIESLKAWAQTRFSLPSDQPWRSIAPLARALVAPLQNRLLLVGDAARVVEPFTGEGIAYALASGELAARHLLNGQTEDYPRAHAALYRGRLWLNRFTRFAVEHPRIASTLLALGKKYPPLFATLTAKVIGG